jgi:hypothetical protein
MELVEVRSVLSRTPDVVRTLLDGLPDDWVHRNDGSGTWSAYDIVGHLILGDDTNWLPRMRMILEYGTQRSFDSFDREAMLRWEREDSETLVARFRDTRHASVDELTSLQLADDDLNRRGRHPQFGDLSLGQLLATWAAHDLTHLAQITEVLARRFRDDIGPMRAFMPALDEVAAAE